jgi:hypothetical protein
LFTSELSAWTFDLAGGMIVCSRVDIKERGGSKFWEGKYPFGTVRIGGRRDHDHFQTLEF